MDALFRISPIFWGHLTILLGYSKLVFTISFSTNFSAKILYGLQFFFFLLFVILIFFFLHHLCRFEVRHRAGLGQRRSDKGLNLRDHEGSHDTNRNSNRVQSGVCIYNNVVN